MQWKKQSQDNSRPKLANRSAFLFGSGLEAVGSGVADVDGFGLAFECFHLDGEMVDAKARMQLFTDQCEQLGMLDRLTVRYVSRERVHAGRDRPDVQVVNAVNTFGFGDRSVSTSHRT